MTIQSTLSDVTTLRQQARANIDQGAVTAGYSADRSEVVKLLNDALATELVCVLRYRRHHQDPTTSQMLKGILAVEEEHADELADLLVGLPKPA